jgi:hypothetical protein
LDAPKLDELRTALGDLKIVDVNRKPKGLSENLRLSADFSQQEAIQLALRGFYVGRLKKDGPVELCSGDGEFRVLMDDGVEYVLRFGEIAGATAKKTEAEKTKDEKSKKDKKDAGKKGDGLNRYLLVMAEFNPETVAKPKFLPMPEPPKEKSTAKPDEKSEKKDEKKDAKKDEKKAEKKDDGKKTVSEKEKYEAERLRVEKENKRIQEEYDQQLADGKKHVAALNARFADWYYIIPDDVYSKIHLGRADIIKKKDPKEKKAGEHAHE